MKEQLEQRLNGLKVEFDAGQKALAELDDKQVNLRSTLMRISGAIQVLEEELGKFNGNSVISDQPSDLMPGELVESCEEVSVS